MRSQALVGLGVQAGPAMGAVPGFGVGLGSFSPMSWLGDAASAASADGWKSSMVALWSAAMWALGVAFHLIDTFTDPDLSATGPLRVILPYTFGIGAAVAALMVMLQLGAIAWSRDGQSLARVLVGTAQFGAVWTIGLAAASAITAASAGLTKALLRALLNVGSFAAVATSFSGPRQVTDTVAATVLGLTGLLVVLPAALGYVFIQLARCAALMILTTTSAISAAGLTSQIGRSWFWKSLRWFISASLISPLAALVLGIGVKISQGVVAGSGDKDSAAVGMALVSSMLVLIGAVCPLLIFRMLAFVDPGTSSGAAVRSSFAASGGVASLMGGAGDASAGGSSAGTAQGPGGRSMGESDADSLAQGRFAQSMGRLGGALGAAGNVMESGVSGAASVGTDVLGSAGVGHPGSAYSGRSGSSSRGSATGSSSGSSGRPGPGDQPGNTGDPGVSSGDPGAAPILPPPPSAPPPVQPPQMGLPPGSPSSPAAAGTSAAGGGAGAGAAAAADGAAEVIPVALL